MTDTEQQPRHWRKRLKNGDVQFYFDTGTSHGYARGSASDEAQANFLIDALAARAGVRVPEPEWKGPRP